MASNQGIWLNVSGWTLACADGHWSPWITLLHSEVYTNTYVHHSPWPHAYTYSCIHTHMSMLIQVCTHVPIVYKCECPWRYTCMLYVFIIHVCLHTTYMCTSAHLHHVCTYIPLYALQCTCVFTPAYTCVSAPVSTSQRHVCTHICACVSTCICLCSHTVYAHVHA